MSGTINRMHSCGGFLSILRLRSGKVLSRSLMCWLALLASNAYAEGVPEDCTQLIVAVSPTWDSARGELRLFERSPGGNWDAVSWTFTSTVWKKWSCLGNGPCRTKRVRPSKKGARWTSACWSIRDREGFRIRPAVASRSRLSVPPGDGSGHLER